MIGSALERLKRGDNEALYHWAIDRYRRGSPLPVCPVCGNIFFDREDRPGRPRVYCSDWCRHHGWELRWRECPVCLQWYDRMDKQGRLTRRYCSDSCQTKARHRRHRGQPIPEWQFRELVEGLPPPDDPFEDDVVIYDSYEDDEEEAWDWA